MSFFALIASSAVGRMRDTAFMFSPDPVILYIFFLPVECFRPSPGGAVLV
jgi:hypothetical protein